MRRKFFVTRLVCLLLVVTAFAVHDARGAPPSHRQTLREMNEKINEALMRAIDAKLDIQSVDPNRLQLVSRDMRLVVELLDELEELKWRLMAEFPPVFGEPFATWYDGYRIIDLSLDFIPGGDHQTKRE